MTRERIRRWCEQNATAAVLGLALWFTVGVVSVFLVGSRWQTIENLARALKAEARWRSSDQVGWQPRSLNALVGATQQTGPTPELRNEAIAVLSRPDLEVVREWNRARREAHIMSRSTSA